MDFCQLQDSCLGCTVLHLLRWQGRQPGSYFWVMVTWQLHGKYVTMESRQTRCRLYLQNVSQGMLILHSTPCALLKWTECVLNRVWRSQGKETNSAHRRTQIYTWGERKYKHKGFCTMAVKKKWLYHLQNLKSVQMLQYLPSICPSFH